VSPPIAATMRASARTRPSNSRSGGSREKGVPDSLSIASPPSVVRCGYVLGTSTRGVLPAAVATSRILGASIWKSSSSSRMARAHPPGLDGFRVGA
jgi:hypothetical protein